MTIPKSLVVEDIAPYLNNMTALHREVPAVFRPQSEADVQLLVDYANEHQLKLHPISRGKNWGVGSKLPVKDGTAIVDLSAMQRVLEVSEQGSYAIIEPGVTQAILCAYLREHHPTLLHNSTGSYAHTSVAGNVLDRGDSIYRERAEDLLGVSGILGCGEPFAVGGFWSLKNQPTHFYPRGLGPDLRGMFAQSNFGIVTKAVIRLLRKPESVQWLWGYVPQPRLADFVDAFDRLCDQEVVVRNNTRIGYVNRFEDFVNTVDHDDGNTRGHLWTVFAIICGSEASARARLNEATEVLKLHATSTGSVDVWREKELHEKLPSVLHPLISLLFGEPDSMSIRPMYKHLGLPVPKDELQMDPDDIPFGMKVLLPVFPVLGAEFTRAIEMVDEQSRAFGIPIQLQVNLAGKGLITINFRKDRPEQVSRADACYRALFEQLVRAGYPPYKLSIDQMHLFEQLQPGVAAMVDRLKRVLDPNDVIAPGRYSK